MRSKKTEQERIQLGPVYVRSCLCDFLGEHVFVDRLYSDDSRQS